MFGYQINNRDSWRSRGAYNHYTHIPAVVGAEISITNIRGDAMIPCFTYDQCYQIQASTTEHWKYDVTPVTLEGATAVFTVLGQETESSSMDI